MAGETLGSARYRWLVEQIRDELGGGRGWKVAAAERLGVSDVYVGYIEKGRSVAGTDVIERAQKKLGLHFRYFHDPDLGPRPPYQDHIVSGIEAAWRTFKRRFARIDDLTPEQLVWIRDAAARGGMERASADDFERLAEMLLRDKPSEIFEKKRQ